MILKTNFKRKGKTLSNGLRIQFQKKNKKNQSLSLPLSWIVALPVKQIWQCIEFARNSLFSMNKQN